MKDKYNPKDFEDQLYKHWEHASISTEMKVVQKLKAERKTILMKIEGS